MKLPDVKVIEGLYSIARYAPGTSLSARSMSGRFFSMSQSEDELSLVCETKLVEDGFLQRDDGWSLMMVVGPLDFSLTGVLSALAAPLASAAISIFAISTYDTDYLLVKKTTFEQACAVLSDAGFSFVQ